LGIARSDRYRRIDLKILRWGAGTNEVVAALKAVDVTLRALVSACKLPISRLSYSNPRQPW